MREVRRIKLCPEDGGMLSISELHLDTAPGIFLSPTPDGEAICIEIELVPPASFSRFFIDLYISNRDPKVRSACFA